MVYLSVSKLVHSPQKNSLRMNMCVCVSMCGWNMICPARVWNQLHHTHTHTHTHTQERYTLYSTVTMEMLGSFKGLHLHNGNCIYRCRPAVIHIKHSWLKLSMTNHSGCSQFVVTVCMFEQEFSEVNSEQSTNCAAIHANCIIITFTISAFTFSIYTDNGITKLMFWRQHAIFKKLKALKV